MLRCLECGNLPAMSNNQQTAQHAQSASWRLLHSSYTVVCHQPLSFLGEGSLRGGGTRATQTRKNGASQSLPQAQHAVSSSSKITARSLAGTPRRERHLRSRYGSKPSSRSNSTKIEDSCCGSVRFRSHQLSLVRSRGLCGWGTTAWTVGLGFGADYIIILGRLK